jgi:hypothetical protein
LGVTADFSAHVSDLSSSLVHNSDSLSSSLSSNFSNMESSLSSVLGDDYSLVSSYVETLRSELATLSDDISSFLADGSAEADLLSDVQDSAESESQSLINSPSGAEWMRVMDKTYSYNMIDSSLSIAGSWLDCYRLTKITHVEGSEDFEINGITVSPGGTGMGWLYLGGNGSTFITAYSGSRVKLHVYWTDSDGNGLTDDLDDTDGDGVPNGNDDADRGGIPSDSDRDGDGINDDLATPDIPNFNFETGIPNLDRILDKLSPDINFKPAGQSNYNLDFSINSGAAGTFNFSLGDYSLIDDVRVTIRIISKVAFSFFFLLSVIKALRQW